VKEIKVDAKPKQINEAEVKNLFGEFPKKSTLISSVKR
jgi:hypothetical protein